MSIEFGPEPDDATPLNDEDYDDLKPDWVSDRNDLNQAEAENIAKATDKYLKKKLTIEKILDDLFVRNLHKDMYSDVWVWAGKYRTTDTSIGIEFHKISEELVQLMENAKYWLNSSDPDDIDKAVCQIHHKLVEIHPFKNGNGRMGRLFADLLLQSKGRPRFTWGGGNIEKDSAVRPKYVEALKAADRGDYSLLYVFVRSTPN